MNAFQEQYHKLFQKLDGCFCDDTGQYPECKQCLETRRQMIALHEVEIRMHQMVIESQKGFH